MEKKPESIFINRELSWLDFDSRVLALAKEKTVPLEIGRASCRERV